MDEINQDVVIDRDQPEADVIVKDKDGNKLSRYSNYWAWHDAQREELYKN